MKAVHLNTELEMRLAKGEGYRGKRMKLLVGKCTWSSRTLRAPAKGLLHATSQEPHQLGRMRTGLNTGRAV